MIEATKNTMKSTDILKSVEVIFKTSEHQNSKMIFQRDIDPAKGAIISFDPKSGKLSLNLLGEGELYEANYAKS